MKRKRVTLDDIADKAYVSKSLVSKVLNNRPVRVSEEKRLEILNLANAMDYIPSGKILQDAPVPKLNKTIALFLPHLGTNFMMSLCDTITHKAYRNGYSVIVFDSIENTSLELKYIDLCCTMNVSGIIFDSYSNASNKKYLEKLERSQIPFVFIDCYPTDTSYSFITSENKKAMKELTENLIRRGHKNILSFIQDKSTLTNVSLQRIAGYYEAMSQHNLRGTNEIIYPERDYRQQPIYSLLESSAEFTAFIIHTGADIRHFFDLIACTKYAHRDHFEVAVFDDFDLSFTEYSFGTHRDICQRIVSIMAQRPKEIAERALDALLGQIKQPDQFPCIQEFIECDLIEIGN